MWKGFELQFGIDLGTSNTLIFQKGKGIVLQEPSVVTIRKETGQIEAFGTEAAAMIGRTPIGLEVVHPVRDGVIADFELSKAMLMHYFQKLLKKFRWVQRFRVVISIPCNTTNVQRRSFEDVARHAGAKAVTIIDEPLAAALGSDLPVYDPIGNLIVHIGGGTTEVAVISLGGLVVSESLNPGGLSINQAIMELMKKKYNLIIGEQTAETLKKQIGLALSLKKEEQVDIRGIDLASGMPKSLSIPARAFTCIFDEFLNGIVESIRMSLEKCPAELAGDIMERGLMLSGGGSLLPGLVDRLQTETQIPVLLVDQPIECVALGIGKILAQPLPHRSDYSIKSFKSVWKRERESESLDTVVQE